MLRIVLFIFKGVLKWFLFLKKIKYLDNFLLKNIVFIYFNIYFVNFCFLSIRFLEWEVKVDGLEICGKI